MYTRAPAVKDAANIHFVFPGENLNPFAELEIDSNPTKAQGERAIIVKVWLKGFFPVGAKGGTETGG